MKRIPCLNGSIISAIVMLLIYSSYQSQDISLYIAEGSFSPLMYPRIFLGLLASAI